jgi:hypothetical protein
MYLLFASLLDGAALSGHRSRKEAGHPDLPGDQHEIGRKKTLLDIEQ